jgi:predicted nucleic acid-binding protein
VRLLLDSTVLIDALRGLSATERLRNHRRAGDHFYTTAVNIEEIVRGLRPNEQDGARRLFASLRIVSLGREEGWQAGEWRREYAQRGVTLSQPDALTAAAALASEARLVTGNPRDFPMEEITVEHWPAGE